MANYLMRYKGKYRLLCELDQNTNDFPRDDNGNIEDIDVYISCQHGNKIFNYGHGKLIAYIPSLGRGRNITKALKEKDVEYIDYLETDEEIEFKFKATDIEVVVELMKAHTSGASISPFSNKNLPRSNVEIPTDKIAQYKEITSVIPKGDLLLISRLTSDFLDNILSKSLGKGGKKKFIPFDYKSDMKKLKLARQSKEYIFVKGYFDEYLDYLKNNLQNFQKNTCN